MIQAWDCCDGLHWTRSDSAAALGHGRHGRRTGYGLAPRSRRRDRPMARADRTTD